jgi:hypothetical protein
MISRRLLENQGQPRAGKREYAIGPYQFAHQGNRTTLEHQDRGVLLAAVGNELVQSNLDENDRQMLQVVEQTLEQQAAIQPPAPEANGGTEKKQESGGLELD